MRQKALEIQKKQQLDRIEGMLRFMLKSGGVDPDTLDPMGDRKEPEAPAGEDIVPLSESDGQDPVDPTAPTDEPPVDVPPAEPPVEEPPVEDKPKARGKNKYRSGREHIPP
jgi:hypothetical protein